jgi:hypothetical protein
MKIYPSIEQLKLKFGLTREEIKQILGAPSSKDRIEIEEGVHLESWEYAAQQIELIFDSDNNYRFSTLSLAAKEVKVNDIAVIGLEESELLKQFPDLCCDEEKDECGYNYEHPEENLMFWIFDGKVELLTIYE